MNKTVMITGGTGYVGSWVVKGLLEKGYTVRLCVRDKSNKSKYEFLQKIADANTGTMELHEADLLKKGSYDTIAEGCEQIFHIASPFSLRIKDPQTQLINPALEGTRNVLQAANNSSTVKRIVLTSSVAAIHGDNKDMQAQGLKEFDENQWNTSSSIGHQPYSYSKVLAEKEAWKIAGAQSRWDLVVINPSFVLGPNLSLSSDSESIQFMGDIVKGKFAMGAPALYFGFVDVRDVAQAHLLAAENIKAEGRYLLAERCASVMDLTTVIAQEFPNKYKLPKSSAPKPLMWLMGPVFGVTRKFISKNVGFPIQLNTSRSTEKLGVKYTPFNETVRDMILRIEH